MARLAHGVTALVIALHGSVGAVALVGDGVVHFAVAALWHFVTSDLVVECANGALAGVDIVIPYLAIATADHRRHA